MTLHTYSDPAILADLAIVCETIAVDNLPEPEAIHFSRGNGITIDADSISDVTAWTKSMDDVIEGDTRLGPDVILHHAKGILNLDPSRRSRPLITVRALAYNHTDKPLTDWSDPNHDVLADLREHMRLAGWQSDPQPIGTTTKTVVADLAAQRVTRDCGCNPSDCIDCDRCGHTTCQHHDTGTGDCDQPGCECPSQVTLQDCWRCNGTGSLSGDPDQGRPDEYACDRCNGTGVDYTPASLR